jgi:hypothetical protein
MTMDAKKTRRALESGERVLMVTNGPKGKAYGLDTGQAVSTRALRSLQGDLFLRPSDDGLFPGHTQTWRAVK